MRLFWTGVNLVLVVVLIGGSWFLYRMYRDSSFNGATIGQPLEAVAAPQRGRPISFPGSIHFTVKTDAPFQGDAVLIQPGGPVLLAMGPVIDLPANAPKFLQEYHTASPNLVDNIQFEWKLKKGKGDLKSAPRGRFKFFPPETGGDVVLSVRGTLLFRKRGEPEVTLVGRTEIRMVCPVEWGKLPEETQNLIGSYRTPKEGGSLYPRRTYYKPPTQFYEVTPENQDWGISPHFRLGDFDMHFDYTTPEDPRMHQFPQYITLKPQLVLKLEEIVGELRRLGFSVDTLKLLAGYRSPAYNGWKRAQGGFGGKYTSLFSRHMYGDAADFYVDGDGDGVMDDMDGDGKIDMEDAAWIRENILHEIDCRKNSDRVGGCGIYPDHDVPGRSIQTPNVHVDTRSFSTPRWYVNKDAGTMPTDGGYWDRFPCETPTPSPPSP